MSALLSPIKDVHSERRLFLSRVILAAVVSILLLGAVVGRLIQLQVVDHELFAEKSQGNRVRIEPVAPIRGLVFDRRDRVLAENLPAYQLELIPEQVDDIDDTLNRLAAINLVEFEDIPRIKDLSRSGPRFKPVTLRFRLTDEEIASFAIQRPRFPGVDFKPRLVRHYPDGELISHAVGYVGALSTDDLQRLDSAAYAGTSHTGKTGIESSFEADLHGDAGYRHLIANARGRQVPSDTSELLDSLPFDETPMPGANVYLTIDLDLQRIAAQAFEGRRGALVALDPQNGEILALISAPAFDPNLFAVGMSTSQYRELSENPDRPLFNRAVRGTYPPGSTIKPMLALAALETGATNLTRKTVCHGYFQLPNIEHRYRDWKPEGHGPVDLHDAIAQSCDVYFYEISTDIGITNMHDYLTRFGLGSATGIDISGERPGLVPSVEWKRSNFRGDDRRWYDGETVTASIGQSYMLATPLQLASAAAALATRGKRYRPHMVAAVEDALTGERRMIQPERLPDVEISNDFYWQTVLGAMHDVMQGPRGTARAVGFGAPYEMAGKSGTAQVVSIAQDEEYDDAELEDRQRDHALFISFAPFDNPRIAVALIVENGESGSGVAAPIARAVMDAYLGYGDDAS
ncbi:MAG: penicillin-binding protein 2 [Gammaproteobacteria bacterium]|nr:penicillin-binding protein 2 [Gammaproteobacteria bacterium]